MNKKIKVVCFGGGNAMPKVVLRAIRDLSFLEITSVTSMVDSGGSTGALRREFNVLPPGDIRRHILELSFAEDWKKKLWSFRFANDIVFEDGHRGHNFANIFIAGLEVVLQDYERVLEIVHSFMKVRGKCLPATLDKVNLCVKLENGQIIKGEYNVDVPKDRDPRLKIVDCWLEPEARAYKPVLEAISEADFIIIGPGDLYSSIVPCFLPKGIKEEVKSSNAKIIFIAPAMTKLGETYGFKLEDFIEVIEKYVGRELDFVICNNRKPSKKILEEYKKENPLFDELVLFDKSSKKILARDLLKEDVVEYDSKKVRDVLLEIFHIKP